MGRSATAPLELSGLGALAWLALEEPTDVTGLLEEFRAAGLEVPAEAGASVVEALEELLEHSLVERS